MSNWKKVKLSECCLSIADGDHQPPPKAEQGIPFVTISNITSLNQFDFSNTLYVPQDYYDRLDEKRKAREGDVLYSVVGSFGIPVFMKENKEFVFQRHIAILRPDSDAIIPQFLFYTMLTRDFYAKADAAALGAAQRTVSLTSLRNIEINIPEKIVQLKIVEILSAFDNLIENNQKQIKLLEEAAQRLYKEWFVDLRFPGYEDVQIVDGVPEGWRLGVLSEVASLNVTAIDYDYPYSEIEYVDLGSVNKGHILGKKKYLLQDAPGRARRLAKHGDVIWGMVRPNLKAYALVQNESSNTVYSTGFAIITAKSVPFTFMYCATTTEEFVGYLVGCTNGAAYPAVKPSHFQDAKILIPSENVLKAFHKITEPIFCKIGYLDEMNNYLAEARDRLLPKLMSGGIEL